MLFAAKDEPANNGGSDDEQRREAHCECRIAAAGGAAFRAVARGG